MSTPTRGDWGEIDEQDLDAEWALAQFLGKSADEAREMFSYNALYYQEDLYAMAPVPFGFYVREFARYITSTDALCDSDGASAFLQLAGWALEERREILGQELADVLLKTAAEVAGKQRFYAADKSIYPDFREAYTAILAKECVAQ